MMSHKENWLGKNVVINQFLFEYKKHELIEP
jgi:hypothetical protein